MWSYLDPKRLLWIDMALKGKLLSSMWMFRSDLAPRKRLLKWKRSKMLQLIFSCCGLVPRKYCSWLVKLQKGKLGAQIWLLWGNSAALIIGNMNSTTNMPAFIAMTHYFCALEWFGPKRESFGLVCLLKGKLLSSIWMFRNDLATDVTAQMNITQHTIALKAMAPNMTAQGRFSPLKDCSWLVWL